LFSTSDVDFEDVQSLDGGKGLLPREDDIESVRSLASGAPVVRTVSDLLELASRGISFVEP
jgi:general secretion pathway protein E